MQEDLSRRGTNQLPLWAIDWLLGRVENTLNRKAHAVSRAASSERHFRQNALQIIF